MQNVSKQYKVDMSREIRNHAFIRVMIGVWNQMAMENVEVTDGDFCDFSNEDIFDGDLPTKLYATCEHNYAKTDGSRYFLPRTGEYYDQKLVTEDFLGEVKIEFQGISDLDIKGFTIDFGDVYPTRFRIVTDTENRTYTNSKRNFVTEDTFDGTSFVRIIPLEMVNGTGRLRIWSFTCGIANTFTNKEVTKFTIKDFTSSVCDKLPSIDMSVTVDNQSQYYSPDNPESAFAYMEVGQPMVVWFGYELSDGNIEWLQPRQGHLKSWKATDTTATFAAFDKFAYKLNGTYYGGKYEQSGITLYDLAMRVINDAGLEDYMVDPWLQNVVVHNPMPVVKYSEALQIIANAGRCVLVESRDGRIELRSSFIPEHTVSTNDQTEFSDVTKLTDNTEKNFYASGSKDFSQDNVYFIPRDSQYLENMGYTSDSLADENGDFVTNPTITLTLENAFSYYGLEIRFKNTVPTQFVLHYFLLGSEVDTVTVDDPDVDWISGEQSPRFDEMVIEFTKGYPLSRVHVEAVVIGDVTDYDLSRGYQLTKTPTATRNNRLHSISVKKHTYAQSTEGIKKLKEEEIVVPEDSVYTVYLSNPSYGYSATASTGTITIVDSSSYFVKMRFSASGTVKYTLNGYEYVKTDSDVTEHIHETGDIITWDNPLIDDTELAEDLLKWLGAFYKGDVSYEIPWRGDPRTEANDLFWLHLKDRGRTLIRAYQNELSFNGTWSGKLKARKTYVEE